MTQCLIIQNLNHLPFQSLSVPASILYDESLNGMAKGEEGERIMDTMTMEVEGITRPLTPTTPLNGARCAEIT